MKNQKNEITKEKKVKLKSEDYNHDNEKIDRREDTETNDEIMWGFVIGFSLFFILLLLIIYVIR